MKDTHLAVRTTVSGKSYTLSRLATIKCGYSLSDIYNIIMSGGGLVSRQDSTAIASLQKALSALRGVHLPAPDKMPAIPPELKPAMSRIRKTVKAELMPARSALLDTICAEIARIGEGRTPTYLYELGCFNDVSRASALLDELFYNDDISSMTPEEISGRCREVTVTGLEEKTKRTFSALYTIRASWAERPSIQSAKYAESLALADESKRIESEMDFSQTVRSILNYIHDIPSSTDGPYFSIINELSELILRCRTYMQSFSTLKPLFEPDTALDAIGEYAEGMRKFANALTK